MTAAIYTVLAAWFLVAILKSFGDSAKSDAPAVIERILTFPVTANLAIIDAVEKLGHAAWQRLNQKTVHADSLLAQDCMDRAAL